MLANLNDPNQTMNTVMMNQSNLTYRVNKDDYETCQFRSPVIKPDSRLKEMAKINPYLPAKNRKKAIAEIEAFMGLSP